MKITKTILAMMFVAFELVPVQAEPSSADTVIAKQQEAKHGKPVTVSGVLSALGQTTKIAAFVATYALPFGSVVTTAMEATNVVASTAARVAAPKE